MLVIVVVVVFLLNSCQIIIVLHEAASCGSNRLVIALLEHFCPHMNVTLSHSQSNVASSLSSLVYGSSSGKLERRRTRSASAAASVDSEAGSAASSPSPALISETAESAGDMSHTRVPPLVFFERPSAGGRTYTTESMIDAILAADEAYGNRIGTFDTDEGIEMEFDDAGDDDNAKDIDHGDSQNSAANSASDAEVSSTSAVANVTASAQRLFLAPLDANCW